MKNKKRFGNDGFTLIEVMLSIAILALISIPLLKYFSDSLRYASITAEKQKATLTAQETMEFVKSQSILMTKQGKLNGSETVMHWDVNDNLKTYFGVWSSPDPYMTYPDFVASQPSFDPDDGKGTMVYQYSITPASYPRGFDVQVTLYTDTGASEVSKPVEYGIEEDTNVVAAEFTEEQDAISDFVAKNTAAYIQRNGGYVVGVTPAPAPTGLELFTAAPATTDEPDVTTAPVTTSHPYDSVELLTEDEIREAMTRDIYVHINRSDMLMEEGINTAFSVRVYYVYHCPNIENTDPTTPSEYVTNDLVNTTLSSLEGIYIMFNKLRDTEDVIHFEYEKNTITAGELTSADWPEIRLVCQDIALEEEEEEEGGGEGEPGVTPYVMTMTMSGFNVDGWQTYAPKVRTNLYNESSPYTPIVMGSCDCPNTTLTLEGLTDSKNPVRIFKIMVDIYRKGKLGSEEPLIQMVSSKTE